MSDMETKNEEIKDETKHLKQPILVTSNARTQSSTCACFQNLIQFGMTFIYGVITGAIGFASFMYMNGMYLGRLPVLSVIELIPILFIAFIFILKYLFWMENEDQADDTGTANTITKNMKIGFGIIVVFIFIFIAIKSFGQSPNSFQSADARLMGFLNHDQDKFETIKLKDFVAKEEKKLLPVLSKALMGMHVLPFMSPHDILYLANSYLEIDAIVQQVPRGQTYLGNGHKYWLENVELFYTGRSLGTAHTMLVNGTARIIKLTAKTTTRFATAFAAVTVDGEMLVWGGYRPVSAFRKVKEKLKGQEVISIASNMDSFAVLTEDGTVVPFGDENTGGKFNNGAETLMKNLKGKVVEIKSCNDDKCFEAITEKKKSIKWGFMKQN